MSNSNVVLQGHGLMAEGAPYDKHGNRMYANGTAGWGHALCRCGEMSGMISTGAGRKAWHRAHKKLVVQAQRRDLGGVRQ